MPDQVTLVARRYRHALASTLALAAGILAGCPPVQKPAATMPAPAKAGPGLAPVLGSEPTAAGIYLSLGSYVPLSGDALKRALADRKTVLAETRSKPDATSQPASAPAETEAPPMAVKYYLQGREKFFDGANSEAMDFLDKALALDPNAFTVLKLMGRVCFAAGQLPKGSIYLQRAYAINPNDVEVNYFLGRYWMERKDTNRAVGHLLQADDSPERTASSAQTPLVSFYLARALQQAGYHKAAAAEYERFLDTIAMPVAGYRYDRELNYLMDEEWATHLEAAENYVVCGSYDKAIPHYQSALQHDATDAFIISRLVNAQIHANQNAAARDESLSLVTASQGSEDSIKLMVWAYKTTGRENQILSDLRSRLPAGTDDAAPALTLAATQDFLGKKADAFNTLSHFLEKHPTNLDVLERLLKRVDSPATYREAVVLAANSLHAVPDKHDDILKMFLPIANYAKDHTGDLKGTTPECEYLQGLACRAIDENTAAEQHFRNALALANNATYFPAREALVSLLLSQEKFKEASALVQEAINKNQGGPKAWQLLIDSEGAQQRLTNALKIAQDARKKFPDSNDLRLQLAAIYRLRGQDAESDKELASLIDDAPKFEPAYRTLINAYFARANDLDATPTARDKANTQAQDYVAKLSRNIPSSVFGRMHAAVQVAKEGRLMDAEASLRRLAAEHPDDVDVLTFLAELRQVLGLPHEATNTLEEPLRKNPSPDLAAALAHLYRDQEKPSEALELTARMVKEHPDDESYVIVDALELGAQKKYADAISELAQAAAKFPKSEDIAVRLSRLQSDYANPVDAVATLQTFIAHNGETAGRLYTLSHAQSAAGQDAAADATLQRVLVLMPDHTGANNDLAYSWTNQGKNLDQADAMLQKAIDNEPNNSAFVDSLGWLYYKQGHFDKAVPLFEKAIALPQGMQPEVLQHLADALYRNGNKAEAAVRFRQARELILQDDTALTPERRKVKTYVESTLAAIKDGHEPTLTPTAAEATTPTTQPR